MSTALERQFREAAPAVDYCSMRFVRRRDESVEVRRDVLEPVRTQLDEGVMFTVVDGDGMGYGATSDLSPSGLRRAAEAARDWARRTAGRSAVNPEQVPRLERQGSYETPVARPWSETPLEEKVAMLQGACRDLAVSDRIVDRRAGLTFTDTETVLLSSEGGRLEQRIVSLAPSLEATANEGAETQTRTFGGHARVRQGGLELLDSLDFSQAAPGLAAEAVELLDAPDCPSGRMQLLLDPDQMVLQVHESIGHPLELDRILGDERNYAGTSFVTLDMLGTYRYGSDLLDVTFDPTRPEQLASYGFDDEGHPAERVHLIEKGILVRGLGGATSQARAGVGGVANSRATSWNRPPIDRMANINLEPRDQSLDQLISAVERGVYMKTNCSWSIDDSRNKFQFGCEWARVIEDGELGALVRKPNYRGISATFWRNLVGVGDESTFEVLGTPNCGKGEPNQLIAVGHAVPACLFADVEVFGGA